MAMVAFGQETLTVNLLLQVFGRVLPSLPLSAKFDIAMCFSPFQVFPKSILPATILKQAYLGQFT